MRYWKGSIALSLTQDYPLLQQVLRSNFVTHRQLYDLLRLDYHATSRNAFNNRVRRLVKHQYLVRDEIALRRDGYVYSISDIGASELIGLGEYYTGPTRRPRMDSFPEACTMRSNSTKSTWRSSARNSWSDGCMTRRFTPETSLPTTATLRTTTQS